MKKITFVYSINMPNIKQNNEIEHINKEINSLQGRLKINEKSLNQFQNGLMQIRRIQVKKRQMTNLSQTKKIQNILKIYFKIRLSKSKKILIYYKIYLRK